MATLLNTVVRSVAAFAAGFNNLIYPPHCLLSGEPLLPDQQVLPGISRRALDRCPPAPEPIELLLLVQRHIAADDLAVTSFRAVWAVTDDSPIRHAIHAIKYHNRRRLAYAFGTYVGELVDELDKVPHSLKTSSPTLIVPIPIHAARRRERGYNQAELIARGVADVLGLPMSDVLRRSRYTGTQTALSEQQRLTNLVNAFEVHTPSAIRNSRILLVDDVLTTGATLNVAAEALLSAGARRVDALTIGATL